ncbi:MAG: hypothetical protein ACI857_001181 [Arenicella sp.]|jgi:hypothetical protein
MRLILTFIPLLLLLSCGSDEIDTNEEPIIETAVEMSKSDSLIQDAIIAHGGDLYNQAHYKFTFRDKLYTFKNDSENYTYTSEYQTDQGWQIDELINGDFNRSLDDKKVILSEQEAGNYGESLNSVVYFATLPHKLSDASVSSEHKGQTIINLQKYEVVKVTFNQDGGGEDFEDEYVYWINSKTKTMDYFAYNYQVNGGGVRFRVAYNPRTVDGVLFQDYANHSAEVDTPLEDLPALFELDSLPEISIIELVGVKSLKWKVTKLL